MPKVTVVIPAYNVMEYLPETLETVFKQTFKDFEIIIVNDGSSDGIENWAAQVTDPRFKLISQENRGATGARNTGIAHAQGDYIAFLDADDLWDSTKLAKQVTVLDENVKVGLVYTWVALTDQQGKLTGRIFKNYAEGEVWQQLIEHNIVECGSVPMIRRSCFHTVGLFDQNIRYATIEDWDMWLRIAACYPFKVVKESLVYYRQHPASGSKNWEAMAQGFPMVIEKAFDNAPLELHHLKRRSYAAANLCLAWKPLQSQSQDYKKAVYFLRLALQHNPQIRFSKEYLRLILAIAIMRWFGTDGYQSFLSGIYALRRRAIAIRR